MAIKQILLQYNLYNRRRISVLQKRLIKKEITILASNCLGGLLYHELGLRFLSPTVNTRFSSVDFVKFVTDLEHYLNCNLLIQEDNETFPVAMIDDVTVNFVHYNNSKEATKKWEERKQRINWDNIFILLNDCDGLSEKELEQLDNSAFKNILVFTAKEYSNYRCAFCLPCFQGEKCVGNTMAKNLLTGEMKVEEYFDFVGWFNQEKGDNLESYRRK